MNRLIVQWLGAFVLSAMQLSSLAQVGEAPVALIVPYPPGGVIDVVARQFKQPLQEALGQTIVVENRPGVAGTLGLHKVLSPNASRLQVAVGTDSDTLLAPLSNPSVKFQPQDLRLIGLLGRAPMFLAASPSSQVHSLQAMLPAATAAEAAPLRFGNFGVDSSSHLIAAEFERLTGVRAIHVSYKGIAPLIQDLMGGHIDLAFLPMAGTIPATIASGKLRAFGMASSHPHPMYPDIPTIAAAAHLREFNFDSWSGVVVAGSLPRAEAARLNIAVQRALGDETFRKALSDTGAAPASPMSLEDADRFFLQATAVARQLLAANRAPVTARSERP